MQYMRDKLSREQVSKRVKEKRGKFPGQGVHLCTRMKYIQREKEGERARADLKELLKEQS